MSTLVPPAIARIAPDGNLTPRQKRRFMVDMVRRRIRPGAGSSVEFLQRRTAMQPWPDLRDILDGIPWVIVGGVATRAYMPERTTQDMDILVSQADGTQVIRRLTAAGYSVVAPLGIPGFLLRSPDGIEIDVLFGNDIWTTAALTSPSYDAVSYPVISLPYLILMKLVAQRVQDWADVSRMLGWASDADLEAVRAVIRQYSPDDLEDLDSLIFLGRQERDNPQ